MRDDKQFILLDIAGKTVGLVLGATVLVFIVWIVFKWSELLEAEHKTVMLEGELIRARVQRSIDSLNQLREGWYDDYQDSTYR